MNFPKLQWRIEYTWQHESETPEWAVRRFSYIGTRREYRESVLLRCWAPLVKQQGN